MISYNIVLSKSKYINSSKFNLKNISLELLSKKNLISAYLNNVNEKLKSLDNPYSLNLKKYLFIKYILSIIFFLVFYFRTSNLFLSLTLFFIMFFIPNFLIISFIRKENLILIGEISNIVQSLILSLSTNMTLYQALQVSINSLRYSRFKECYKKFVDDYLLFNLNIRRAVEDFKNKFNSYEFNMFIGVLLDSEKNLRFERRTGNF